MATFKEHLIKERTEWRDTILQKFRERKWYDVLHLMACNYGEEGSIYGMIMNHCENADPIEGWRKFI